MRFPIRLASLKHWRSGSGITGDRGVRFNSATILALSGELGSGKTTFTQGLAKGISIPRRLVSPTFLIVKEYQVNLNKFKKFIHIDLYRIETEAGLAGLGLNEIFTDPLNLVTIEWPEKLGDNLPQKRVEIRFELTDEQKRKIIIGSQIKFS